MQANTRTRFRERLAANTPIVVPGCYDALSALIVERTGFEATLVSGFGMSASLLGMPDMELYTQGEMVATCRYVCRRLTIPVMADADNGYGNALNVMRTVADLEAAGVVSLTLEDQQSPKACPLLSEAQRSLVSVDEAVGKLKAALAARRDPSLVIVARTDARDDEEVRVRAKAYAEAGADLVKITARVTRSFEGLQALREACGVPLMISGIGWAASIRPERFAGLVGVVTHPLMPVSTAAAALHTNLTALREGTLPADLPLAPMGLEPLEAVMGIADFRAAEDRFLPER